MNVNLMIYILGNENQTYNKIYNPVGVPCDICIYVSPLYSVLIHWSFCPGKMPIQSSTTWIFQLLPRNEASFEFRWGFMVPRVMWLKNSMFSLLLVLKSCSREMPPPPPQKNWRVLLENGALMFNPHWWQRKQHPWDVRRWGKVYQDSTSEPRITKCLTWWRFQTSRWRFQTSKCPKILVGFCYVLFFRSF